MFWFDTPDLLLPAQEKDLESARSKLASKNKRETANHVVAELSFGFWTALLSKPYEDVVTRPLLRGEFPNWPSHLKQRNELSKRFQVARTIRNRAHHLEPIWHRKSLDIEHEEIKEAIVWLSPLFGTLLKTIDRFPHVLAAGPGKYRVRLEQLLPQGVPKENVSLVGEGKQNALTSLG